MDNYERQLDAAEYEGVAKDLSKRQQYSRGFFTVEGFADGPITPERINGLLAQIRPPYGYGVLAPLPLPEFPSLPSRPNDFIPAAPPTGLRSIFSKPPPPAPRGFSPEILEKEARLIQKTADKRSAFQRKHEAIAHQLTEVRTRCEADDLDAVRFMMNLAHARNHLPAAIHRPIQFDFDQSSRVLLCSIEIPDFAKLPIVKRRGKSYEYVPVAPKERKVLNEALLYSLCIRAAFLAAQCNIRNWFDVVAVNASQQWNDRATGSSKQGIIASLQGSSREFMGLRPDQIDPKTCFRHFKGISTPSVEDIAAVRPIFILNKDDKRVVGNRDVDSEMDVEANIAAMPWEDFEHLVRQLFEWEFGGKGVEVKVFRLSRDHGVDAVMYDPDPLRGGKYVLQAKRYTRTVDVAAVRDLYGTVINEGANRGILVTTSGFGPDSRDFVKDKPITLIDGSYLVQMLRKHGRNYRIDLAEARKLNKEGS
ncbi:restriction endonuclease [Bradyrhizobium sacchari]|uniref:restriction endonuclease n=1 Tax=Bradyrhizobium sacchari TaxID=1399419 RepID=UPI0013747CBB|nr:restriction endonuclease [Bradyrhizobium sacchari]